MAAESRRDHVRSGSAFERLAGYSRAVRAGAVVAVSGTAALDGQGRALHRDDVYAQTREAIASALAAALELGAEREHVIMTRLFLAPGVDWKAAARAHGEAFAGVDPANTTLFVGGLIPDGCLVEFECTAQIDSALG